MSYGQVTISWNQNPEADMAGYIIGYGTSPGVLSFFTNVGLTATPSAPSFIMGGFLAYGLLWFAVAAYDTSNNNSAFSSPSVSKAVAPKLFPMAWP